MKSAFSESELLSAIATRDPAAAAALYDKYAPTLYKVICCKTGNCAKAEKILEKTFTTIWNNIHDYHNQDKRLLLWMVSIARSHAHNTN
jgi:RNA polymerase sigma-70 factor (ECF subfamily)